MKNKYDQYDAYYQTDKSEISKEIISQSKEEDIPVEQDPDVLKDIIDMDFRENVPPQIYELISCVVEMIDQVEKKGF